MQVSDAHATIRAALETVLEEIGFIAPEWDSSGLSKAVEIVRAHLDTLAVGQWIPISGNIVIEANGKLYTVTPGVIGDWNLPDDIRLCRLISQPDVLKALHPLGYRPSIGDDDA